MSEESDKTTAKMILGVTALMAAGAITWVFVDLQKIREQEQQDKLAAGFKKRLDAERRGRVKSVPDPGDPAPGWYAIAYSAPGGDIRRGRPKEGAGPFPTRAEAEQEAARYRNLGYVPSANGVVEVRYSNVMI